MELRQLRYFVGVAEQLNFTRAARKLRVAQPALSRQIRQLEAELGVTLLERDRRGARLTKTGERFLAEARAVLAQSEQAIRSAQATESAGAGQLKVGYVWGLFHSVVPPAVARFRQLFPGVGIHLFDLTATQQADALAEGTLDVGYIGFADEADAAGLRKRKVGTCNFMAVLPASHPAARRSKVSLAMLAPDFFCAISERNYPSASRVVAEACARAGFRPRILQAAERGHTILSLVASNCGVALLPESLRALPHPAVVFRPLENPPTADLYLAWSPSPGEALRDAFLKTLG